MMVEIVESATFSRWIKLLRDVRARARILARIDRMSDGNFGDVAPVGGGLSEARIHYGPGYRIYFLQRRGTIVILLCGGTKKSQAKDIESARQIAQDWSRQHR